MKIKFRTLSPDLLAAIRHAFPEWNSHLSDIFTGLPADVLVSPANCTGRMDGGIDQVYIDRFGWQLERRLMRDIQSLHGGRLPVGEARLISTYDPTIPLMICAPTMDWPPRDVGKTDNAFLAFKAVLNCVAREVEGKVLGREATVLLPGLATGSGRMHPDRCAEQMRRAWEEFQKTVTSAASMSPLVDPIARRPAPGHDGLDERPGVMSMGFQR